MAVKLAIFAGGGELPARLAEAARGSGRDVFMVAFEGHTLASAVVGVPHLWSRFGAASAILDFLHGLGQLLPAITPERSEHIPRQAFTMNPDQGRFDFPGITHDKGEMIFVFRDGTIQFQFKQTEPGRHVHCPNQLHQSFLFASILDQVCNGGNFQAVF